MSNKTPWLDESGELVAGLYYGCPEPVYRKLPALNWSRAKIAVLKGLATCKRQAEDYARGITGDTAGRRENRLVHALVLDPEAVRSEFRRAPFSAWRTKDAKAWKAAQEAAGYTPITSCDDPAKPGQWERAQSAAKAVRSHAAASRLLASSRCEVVALAKLPVRLPSGEWVNAWAKCKVDLLAETTQGFFVGDLKAASDPTPDAFVRVDAAKHGYTGQLDLYSEIVRAAMLQSGTRDDDPRATPLRPYWIAHHEPTSRVTVIQCATRSEIDDGLALSDRSEMQKCGRALWQTALSLYVDAERSGRWPQRYDETTEHAPASWPAYAPGMDLDTWEEIDDEH